MNYILDILLSKCEINKINLSELLVEWRKEKFVQIFHKYTTNSKLFFIECIDKDYYERFLETQYPIV